MQRLPVNLVTHPEIYAQLVEKVWLTVADLSDSFFQMMLKAECQALTAFYSEAHGKLYCFTRCPQGLKNSPLHLKLLLDANHKKDKNRTYKNQARVSKTFELGQIVAHRQLQLATGPNMSMEPKFDGFCLSCDLRRGGVSDGAASSSGLEGNLVKQYNLPCASE